MRGSKFQHHLLLGAKSEGFHVPPLAQITNMQRVTIAALQQNFGVHSLFDHVRRAPLAADERVVSQMPPEVITEILRSAIDFPLPQDVEAVRIEDENAARSVPIGRAKGAHEDAIGAAMHGVRTAVSGARGDGFGLNHLYDFWFSRIGLGIDNVNPGRSYPRHYQVAPLRVRVRSIRAKACAARVPAAVMQFITDIGHLHISEELAAAR